MRLLARSEADLRERLDAHGRLALGRHEQATDLSRAKQKQQPWKLLNRYIKQNTKMVTMSATRTARLMQEQTWL